MKVRLQILALFTIFAAGCASAPTHSSSGRLQRAPGFGPWSVSADAPVVRAKAGASKGGAATSSGFVDFAFSVYSRYITKVDGARCEHRPTCSRYAVDAIHKHGYVLGAMLTIDRLLRGQRSSVLRNLPIHKVEDGRHYFDDPVESNDFFF